ncbi:MAG: DinB family protein [Deltaproteobacteria bacterium]
MDASEIRNLFDYDYWANRETLASLAALDGDASRARKFFYHILGAQRVWLSRFETPDSPVTETWPSLTLEDAASALADLRARWTKQLDGLTSDGLSGDLVYRNTKGQEFRTPIRDVLIHLVMHSVYHRGQVAAAVRDSGGKPSATDYVVYVRHIRK